MEFIKIGENSGTRNKVSMNFHEIRRFCDVFRKYQKSKNAIEYVSLFKINQNLLSYNIIIIISIQGQLYAADIVLDCTGIVPETSLTRQAFGKHELRKISFFRGKRRKDKYLNIVIDRIHVMKLNIDRKTETLL